MGWSPPSTPLTWALILGPKNPSKSGLKKAEFFRFFGPCGAPPRGGGGAPPTTLILLRNQVNARVAAARPRVATTGGRSGGLGGHSGEVRKGEKRVFQFGTLLGVSRPVSRLCRSGLRPVAVGGLLPQPPSPMAKV